MQRLYSYVLRYDDGAAPNPFWGCCTLAICKPGIRKSAKVGDWVIGVGSRRVKLHDGHVYNFGNHLVYAIKVTAIKSFQKYDQWCRKNLPQKIPNVYSRDWHKRVGDCIYDFSCGLNPIIRDSVHNEKNRDHDLKGLNVLISNQFYYFGDAPVPLPKDLLEIVKENQGYKINNEGATAQRFTSWLAAKYQKGRLYGIPQRPAFFDGPPDKKALAACATRCLKSDKDE